MKLTLTSMRDAVQRKNASLKGNPFTVKEKEEHGIVVFNYAFAHPGLFDGPDGPLLRECRGVIFSDEGELLSRPYHKFFNVGEHAESKLDALPFEDDHHILEKMDGSMLRPIMLDKGMVFGTKAGPTDVSAQVDHWAKSHDHYLSFCRHCISKDWTPIFEWCSRKMRIVIDYPVDRLVLTGIRVNDTGEYLSYLKMNRLAFAYEIEIVTAYDLDIGADVGAFVQHVSDLDDLEGYVLRWSDRGLMAKIKADEYLRLHRTLDILKSEKTLVGLIVDGTLDDATPRLRDVDADAVRDFQDKVMTGLQATAKELAELAAKEHARIKGEGYSTKVAKKRFSVEVAKGHPAQGILFKLWAGIDKDIEDLEGLALSQLKSTIQKKVGRLDEVRHLFGDLRWDDYRAGLQAEPSQE